MTRRFDIGPFVLALGALVLLVSLFLPWVDYGTLERSADATVVRDGNYNAWQLFEITDLLLAGLAITALLGAIGLLVPDADYIERRYLPWLVGAAFLLVVNQLLEPGVIVRRSDFGLGIWLAFGATIVMALGTLLALGKVHFAVAVEGRDRRRRVSAVDHRPPPTESGEPVARRSSLLDDPPEAGKES